MTEHRVIVHGPLAAAEAARLRPALLVLLEGGAREVAIDLSGVTTVDATALTMLAGLARRFRGRSRVALVEVPPNLVDVLRLTALDRLLLGDRSPRPWCSRRRPAAGGVRRRSGPAALRCRPGTPR